MSEQLHVAQFRGEGVVTSSPQRLVGMQTDNAQRSNKQRLGGLLDRREREKKREERVTSQVHLSASISCLVGPLQ